MNKSDMEETEAIEKCKHDKDSRYCYECADENQEIEYQKGIDEKLKAQLENLNPDLIRFGVPKKYLGCSFDNYIEKAGKYKTECQKYLAGGMVLTGNTGCGKTHLAVAIVKKIHSDEITRLLNMTRKPGYAYYPGKKCFVSIPDLLLEIRMTYDKKSSLSEADIIEKYTNVPFLILDDLGSEKTSEFSITTLYLIIDRRDREEMSTIITTNLTNEEIEKTMNARIASRMAGMKNIKINMDDYRKKR